MMALINVTADLFIVQCNSHFSVNGAIESHYYFYYY